MKSRSNRVAAYFCVSNMILFIPITCFAIYDSAFSSFSSILAMLWQLYPSISRAGIQMVLAIPSLTAVPTTLIVGILSPYVHKKHMAIVALLFLLVGGLAPAVLPDPNIIVLFTTSALIGVGQGLLHPLASMLVCSYWTDESERSRIFGFKQAVNYLGAAAVSLIVGMLALLQWNLPYLIYLGVIPVLIFCIKRLPRGTLEEKLVDKNSQVHGLKKLLVPSFFYACFIFFFVSLFNFTFQSNIAMLVNEKGLGEVVSVAVINAMLQLCSFVIGVLYGKIVKQCKCWTLPMGFILLAAGFAIVALADSLPSVFFGSAIFGVGAGIQYVTTLYYTSESVDQSVVSMALSIVLSLTSLGFSVSPIVIEGIKGIIVGASAGADVSMVIAGIGCAILSVVEIIKCTLVSKRRN